jgi:AraC-like DNA-binding protein
LRVALEKNIENPINSITVLDLKEPFFDPNWHFHPHYQLFTVIEGEGTRLIGDSIQHFEVDDTVLLGPDLPHLWRNDKRYFEPNSELKTRGIVVYFTQEFLDRTLSNLPESVKINKLLKESSRGLEFKDESKSLIKNGLLALTKTEGYEKVLMLLSLLHALSQSSDRSYVSSLGYINTHKQSETERMHRVYEYAMKHFKDTIKLEVVADLANMTVPAFCRYFKKRSNKTFSGFLAEIRIGQACKLLENDENSIAQICYESGFNTLSNFNKKFKELMHTTPSKFKKELLGK